MRLSTRIGLALALATTSLPLAYAYSVQPMVYAMTPSGSGATARLTITNTKEGQLNIEIQPFAVVADDAGKRTFTPAPDDFLIFPPQASIAGDKSQLFQVRYVGAPTMAKGRAYVLRVVQTNASPLTTAGPDPAATVQAQLMMSVNFNTTAIVQPRDLTPDVAIERDLAPDPKGILRGRITNRGNGVADLTRIGWSLDREGKEEAVTLDQVGYGEALFLEPGRSRDIAMSDKIRAPARLVLTQPGTNVERSDRSGNAFDHGANSQGAGKRARRIGHRLMLTGTAAVIGGTPAMAGPAARPVWAPPRLTVDTRLVLDASQATPAAPSIVPRGQVDITAPLLVNDRLVGEIDVRADAAGTGDIDAARLVDLLGGLLDPELKAALVARVAGRARVPFDALSVDPIAIVYDPATLEVRATVPTARMLAQSVSFRGYDTPDPKRFTPQADYAGGVSVGATQRFIESGPNKGRAPLLVSADAFMTVGSFPGVTLQGGGLFTEQPGGRSEFERAQTRVTYDSFANAIHYVAGEFNPAITGFQGSARMIGIGVARDYAGIRPFENIRPSGRGGITLDRPSTVIVEVNGVETRKLQLDAGRYQLTDLSSASGANDVRLFVQDDLGRREVASAAFFTASQMLAPGLTDFGVSLGKRESARTQYGGPFTATGYVRHGIGGNLTVGAGGQYAAGDWQTNAEVVVGTPVGLFRAQGTGSHVAGRSGYAASLDWLHSFDAGGAAWNFTVLSSIFSRNFASPFDRLGRVNDQQWRIDARADWRRGPVGLTASASVARTRNRSEEQRVDLTGYYTRGRLSLTGTAGIEKRGVGSWGPRALFGLSFQLGARTTASLRADTRRGAVVAEVSRFPIEQVDDLSGRLQLVRESDRLGFAGDARYFGNRLIASVEKSQFYAQKPSAIATRETVLRASTFIGIADGSIAIGRPVRGNFAIYDRHKSLKGSTVVIRDEGEFVIARQDWLGAPLAPFNRAFSPVYQTIEVDPLPTGYDLGEGRLAAFPGAFSGYRVAVGSDESRVAIGYLIAPDGPIANMTGTVERIGDATFEPRAFFTNATGRFAVDRLAPGNYRMLVGATEVARFTVDPKSEGMIDVGKLDAKEP